MPWSDYAYRVLGNHPVTPVIRELQLAPDTWAMPCRAGHYALLGDTAHQLPPRFCPIANAPRADGRASLLRRRHGGAYRRVLHQPATVDRGASRHPRIGYPSMRESRIHTKPGDDGSTGLLFGGRTSKADPLIRAVGSIDEAIAALGQARAGSTDATLREMSLRIQRDLLVVGADLVANPRVRNRRTPGISLVTAEMTTRDEAGSIDWWPSGHCARYSSCPAPTSHRPRWIPPARSCAGRNTIWSPARSTRGFTTH